MPPSRKCSSPTLAGGSRPGTAALATTASRAGPSRTSARPRARCSPRTPGTGPAGPRSAGRRTPRQAAAHRRGGVDVGPGRHRPPDRAQRAVAVHLPARGDGLPQLDEPVDDVEGRVARDHRAVEGADATCRAPGRGRCRSRRAPAASPLRPRPAPHRRRARTRWSSASDPGRRRRKSSGCSARIRCTTRRSTQKMISGMSPAARLRMVKRDAPSGPARQQEGHDHVDHEDPPVQDPQHTGGLPELLQVAALRCQVLQRQRDQGAEGQQHAHDHGEHAVAGEEAAHVERPYRLSPREPGGPRQRRPPGSPPVPTATTRTPRTSRRTTTPRHTAGCGRP